LPTHIVSLICRRGITLREVVTSSQFRHAARVTLAALALGLLPLAALADDPATFIAVGPVYYSSSTFIATNGQTRSSGCDFQKIGESLYAQQRLGAADSLRLSTEYDDVSCSGPGTRGLADIEIDELHGISGPAHPTEFSIEGSVIIPSGYSIAVNPRLGFGRPGAELGTVYSASFKAGTHYGYVTTAVNVRGYTGYPAPQLLTNVTVGLNLTPRLLAYESYYGTTHLGAGGTLTNIGINPTLNASYDSYNLSENLAYALSPRTSLAVTYQALVGGWNTGIGSTLQAGVWLRI
jgi:hypothetical protein